jgi:putative ABC transport system substrate-binding protein
VGAGLVASLARPGGNVTGLASMNDELSGKRLQLLKETLPRLSRVALLWERASDAGQLRATETAAKMLHVSTHTVEIRGANDYEAGFRGAQAAGAQGIIVLASPLFYADRARIVQLAARDRLPAMYHHKDFVVDTGGLMSYGADFRDLFRRAATYVDKILKGVNPADLPVQQPTRFELAINMKTAKALGLTIPQSVLFRADQVIR